MSFHLDDIITVNEDLGDGWWRATSNNNMEGNYPCNYFEVITGDEDEAYLIADNQHQHQNGEDQMKTLQERLECMQKEEKDVERELVELKGRIEKARREYFECKQMDFVMMEVLKMEAEVEVDGELSRRLQQVQPSITQDIAEIRQLLNNVKLDVQQKKHLDERLLEFEQKFNTSTQLLEQSDKSKNRFYSLLQTFRKDLEKRIKQEEEKPEEKPEEKKQETAEKQEKKQQETVGEQCE